MWNHSLYNKILIINVLNKYKNLKCSTFYFSTKTKKVYRDYKMLNFKCYLKKKISRNWFYLQKLFVCFNNGCEIVIEKSKSIARKQIWKVENVFYTYSEKADS